MGTIGFFEVFHLIRDDWGCLNVVRFGPIYHKYESALKQARRLPGGEVRQNGRCVYHRDLELKRILLPTEGVE